jgi:L-amino acid N-acyltransferase YncA
MNNEILIRDATDADMSAVHRVYAHHVLHGLATFEEEPPSVLELKRRREQVLGCGLPYIVAQVAGTVVGYSYAIPYRSRSAYRYTVEDSVYVENDFAGSGIGRMLLAALISGCEAGRWRQMIAIIGDSGNLPSIRLHESLGFHSVGVLRAVGFKFGRWVDTVLMQRELGVGDSSRPGTALSPPSR